MSAFKEQVAADIDSVFLNMDEFGEPHDIDGEAIMIVFDQDVVHERGGSDHEDGTFENRLIFFVNADELGYMPEENQLMQFDGRPFIVAECDEEMGVYRITIEGNQS